MKSMTAYGWAEQRGEDIWTAVEIRGCNNRFLEIQINLPSHLSALEIPVRKILARRCRRGTVEVSIRSREQNAPISVSVNRKAARAYYEAASGIARELEMNDKPDLASVLGAEGVLEVERDRDVEKAMTRLEPILEEALNAFDAENNREGEHTLADILSHLAVLEQSLEKVASFREVMDTKFKETVRARFEELLGNGVDENRVLAETAALLVKYTISEELSRMDAHLKEFRLEVSRNESPGKKLDFLCQEINREINTIGSKAQDVELSMVVVNMKDALENIREQLRNVE
jgi:uncharacterized protein (TIGR00255 family)